MFFRRKRYTLWEKLVDEVNILHESERSWNSVQNVHIENAESLIDCRKSFPNATELVFEWDFSTNGISIVPHLNRIRFLKQLNTLRIKCRHFSLPRLIELLCDTPNLRTLELGLMRCYNRKKNPPPIEKSKDFRLVSGRNMIMDVTYDGACTLEQIKLLVALCPRLNSLTINRCVGVGHLQSIVRFLLDRTNRNTCHLYSICFSRVWDSWMGTLDELIESERLLNDYTLKLIGWNWYLSW